MNKKELLTSVSELLTDASLTKGELKTVIDATFQAIENALVSGDKVAISSFGVFSLVEREARKGRNPQTGAEIQIEAKTSAKFKAAKALKALVKDVKPLASDSDSDSDE